VLASNSPCIVIFATLLFVSKNASKAIIILLVIELIEIISLSHQTYRILTTNKPVMINEINQCLEIEK
ncbi:MAG: hypothetical protein AAFX80_12755, partial [Cyanobacteria bacterium J06639_18]